MPNRKLCANCQKRPATRLRAADATAAAHGWFEMWCDTCVLRKQLAHAKAAAERIPGLEAELVAAERESTDA